MVQEVAIMMKSSLPPSINIVQSIEAEDSLIESNPIHIHQILMNLCTNAAHAMGEKGGILELKQTKILIEKSTKDAPASLALGTYIKIRISDTGQGIEADAIERIFDPYFTTKKPGEGTGLGLSVVHGIVERLKGAITVVSEPGTGTIFHVYLPMLETHL